MTKPLFLFSLPRSGSTLLQRMLTTHPQIVSSAEPWILLPLFYARRIVGIESEYDQVSAAGAIGDFLRTIPSGEARYGEAVRGFAMKLYDSAASAEECYFLDKTPRYALICHDIIRTFPDAKYIFLWRNPLSVVGSIYYSWGRFQLVRRKYKIDVYDGVANLVDCFSLNGNDVISLKYEDLVQNVDAECKRLFAYLELNPAEADVHNFAKVVFDGRMGDREGLVSYDAVTEEPLEKWRQTLASIGRKRWARRYLDWIGRERLAVMGYDYDQLRRELEALPARLLYIPDRDWLAARIRRRLGAR